MGSTRASWISFSVRVFESPITQSAVPTCSDSESDVRNMIYTRCEGKYILTTNMFEWVDNDLNWLNSQIFVQALVEMILTEDS